MPEKRKLLNKQNRPLKKQQSILLPAYYTEEIHLPTHATLELKNFNKSTDLRRTYLQPKKAVSRKARSKSVKQNALQTRPSLQHPSRSATLYPMGYRQIIQQFKELKQQLQKSKSKSPASCKSRSAKKKQSKKQFVTLRTNEKQERSQLTHKLERTLKRLNEADFFREEELIPLASSSDVYDVERQSTVVTDNEEDINLHEMREYCLNATVRIKRSLNTRDPREPMAIVIQRAWRRYRTKRLVKHYIDYFPDFSGMNNEDSALPEIRHSEVIVPTNEFYEENNRERVTQMSNLEDEEFMEAEPIHERLMLDADESYEEAVQRIKLEELQKWNKIIERLEVHKNDDPAVIDKLLLELAGQSELNKKDIEVKANQVLTFTTRLKQEQYAISERDSDCRLENSLSERSDPLKEEYDSKKYIDYLDGEIFQIEKDSSKSSSSHRRLSFQTISKRKQTALLAELKTHHINLGLNALCRSESMRHLQLPEGKLPRTKQTLKKAASQKYLKRAIWSFSPGLDDSNVDINLELLTREFLQGTDPLDSIQASRSEDKLRLKLAELNELREDNSKTSQQQCQAEKTLYEEYKKMQERQKEEEEYSSWLEEQPQELHRQGVEPRRLLFYSEEPADKDHIEEEQPTLHRDTSSHLARAPLTQSERLTESDSEEGHQEEHLRAQKLSTMVANSLIFEFLKEIVKYDNSILKQFKAYSMAYRPKPTANERSRGFKTGLPEIKLFLDEFVCFLSKELPNVFKNLEVATGPTTLQMLEYMHLSAPSEMSMDSEDGANMVVIPHSAFEKFWAVKKQSYVAEVALSGLKKEQLPYFRQNYEYLLSLNRQFYRSLFDAFNECLDLERNFGELGRSYPWKNKPTFEHTKSHSQLQVRPYPRREVSNGPKKEC